MTKVHEHNEYVPNWVGYLIILMVFILFLISVFLPSTLKERISSLESKYTEFFDFSEGECVEWKYYGYTTQAIINNEPVIVVEINAFNITIDELNELLVGKLILSHAFGDQPIVRIDGIKKICTKVSNDYFTVDIDKARELGWEG